MPVASMPAACSSARLELLGLVQQAEVDLADRLVRERVAQRELVAGRPRPRGSGIRAFACDLEVPGPEDRPGLHAEEVRVVRDRQLGRRQPGALRVDRQTRPLERVAQPCSPRSPMRRRHRHPRLRRHAARARAPARGRVHRTHGPTPPRAGSLPPPARPARGRRRRRSAARRPQRGSPHRTVASASSRTPWTGARSRSRRGLSIAGS